MMNPNLTDDKIDELFRLTPDRFAFAQAVARLMAEATRAQCVAAVLAEKVDAEETQSAEDEAYNKALGHAAQAILRPITPQPRLPHEIAELPEPEHGLTVRDLLPLLPEIPLDTTIHAGGGHMESLHPVLNWEWEVEAGMLVFHTDATEEAATR